MHFLLTSDFEKTNVSKDNNFHDFSASTPSYYLVVPGLMRSRTTNSAFTKFIGLTYYTAIVKRIVNCTISSNLHESIVLFHCKGKDMLKNASIENQKNPFQN